MDTRKVFRRLSKKMLEDFEISAQINHQGSKGTYRENALKRFLSEGKLPTRYGIGSGEIIGPVQNVSKQSDLIIFDQLNGLSLIYDESTQVYPIECVAGVIEVKSTLNKTEFLKSLENIRTTKQLVPAENVEKNIANGMRMAYRRPKPFGAIFGYRLGDNSLSSLEANLREWGKEVPREDWPNVIAVLGEGIIHYYGKALRPVYRNSEINNFEHIASIHFRDDTLFKFYSMIVDLCASTDLGPVALGRYFEPSEQVGPFVVSNHNRITKPDCDEVFRLNENFISKVVDECKGKAITHEKFLLQRFGQIPQGLGTGQQDFEVYFYNPDGLKGMHELETPFFMSTVI